MLHSLNDLLNTKPENEAACCVRILCISFGSHALQASKGQRVTALPCNNTKTPTPHMHTFLPWRLPGSSHTLTQRFSWMWCCINTKEQNHWETTNHNLDAETRDRNQSTFQGCPRNTLLPATHVQVNCTSIKFCACCTDLSLFIYIVDYKYKQPEPTTCLYPHVINTAHLEEKKCLQDMDFLGLLNLLSSSPAALHNFKGNRQTKENRIPK